MNDIGESGPEIPDILILRQCSFDEALWLLHLGMGAKVKE